MAIGQAAELSWLEKESVPITQRGGLQGDPVTLETGLPGVFCGGDVFYGPKSVVEAVESGKKAAESITAIPERPRPPGRTGGGLDL